MSLDQLNFPEIMNTSRFVLSEDFFVPALSNSIKYDRVVGFFILVGSKQIRWDLKMAALRDGSLVQY